MPGGDDGQKHHPWGDRRVGPDDRVPEDEEAAVGPGSPDGNLVVRALSVVPFLLLAALGLIGIVSWVLVLAFGVGSGEPIWVSVRGLSAGELLWQLLLALLVGLASLAVVLAASWATARGFREDSSRTFWTATQAFWGLVVIGVVYLWRSPPGWFGGLGFTSTDWWFVFGVVAFAMTLARMRQRRARRAEDG